MKFYTLDFCKPGTLFNFDYKYIIYDGKKIGQVMFTDKIDDYVRDKVYDVIRRDGLDPCKIYFVSEKCFNENYRLYERSESYEVS